MYNSAAIAVSLPVAPRLCACLWPFLWAKGSAKKKGSATGSTEDSATGRAR